MTDLETLRDTLRTSFTESWQNQINPKISSLTKLYIIWYNISRKSFLVSFGSLRSKSYPTFIKYGYFPQIFSKFLLIFSKKLTICGNLSIFYQILILDNISVHYYSNFVITEHVIPHVKTRKYKLLGFVISEWDKQIW